MGACEILFRGQDMCEINALKNAQRIIQRMISNCQDANVIVNNWIDSPEVNIRENGMIRKLLRKFLVPDSLKERYTSGIVI